MTTKTNSALDRTEPRDSDQDGGDGGGPDNLNTGAGQDGGIGADRPDDDTGSDDADDEDANREDGEDADGEDKDGGHARRGGRGSSRGNDKSARTIAALRGDFKEERTKRQQAEQASAATQKRLDEMQAAQTKQMDALAKALGLKKDDTPPSPEEVAKDFGKKLQTAQAETETERSRADTAEAAHRDTAIQLAVYLAADDHDANAQALLDSARFLKTVAGLDPNDKGFSDQIGEAIDKAVEGNDRLRKPKPRTAADRSGGEMNTGAKRQRKRPASLNEAVRTHYDQAK